MSTSDDDIIIGTSEMKAAAGAELLEMIRLGKWPEPFEGVDQLDDDDIIIGTWEMMEAAVAQALELIREGRWPEPYEGDDQLDSDDGDLPPIPVAPLKAAE